MNGRFQVFCACLLLVLTTSVANPTSKDISGHRHRRQTANVQNVFIDTIAVVAFDVYERFYSESDKPTSAEKESDTLARIKKHFALMIVEADRFYQQIGNRLPYTISLRLVGFIIAQTAASSPWTEQNKEVPGDGGRTLISAPKLLQALESWVRDSASLPTRDYYILFTEYDLYTNTSGKINLGRAVFKGVCGSAESNTGAPGSNVAIIESNNFNIAAISTAHELGHGQSEACIHTEATPASDVPDVTGVLPGQLYDIHEQCRLAYGNGSYVCRNEMELGDGMCSLSFCSRPGTPGACQSLAAYRGTTCGNNKWCQYNTCVSSPSAPSLDESCPFGDTRAQVYSGSDSTCADLVTGSPRRCYDSYLATQCCKSCKDTASGAPGCEYGDRKGGCSSSLCGSLDESGLEDCCGTCNYIPSTTSSTSSTSTTTTTTAASTKAPIDAGNAGNNSAASPLPMGKTNSCVFVIWSSVLLLSRSTL